ncbi:RPE-retinal G protein-coupled receptor-like [Brienomyrus brachyistius]|uniref:RPE-retinal G protein-coupled receptor-like n=1 Tax=Brienomyrus brachyistius TaxID=42636 RepID=UPI0020B28D91|nr:RPE-retinal G protein-coupled receptor-like [Brienomyrus brachyistius]
MDTAYILPEGFTDFDMYTFGCALVVEGLSGFLLNFLSILSFLSIKGLRTPNNFVLFNLAVADISLSANGLFAAYASFLRYWPYGPEGCQAHAFHGMVAVLASISFLGVVAWDRYHEYCTRQKLPWATAVTVVVIIWLLAVFWSVLPLKGWGEYDFEPLKTCCTLDYSKGGWNYITYMLSLATLFFVIPAITMHSSYQSIYNQFKRTRKYKFNTNLPLMALMLCWGPYVLLCMFAVVKNVNLLSPKLRMVLALLGKTSPVFHFFLYAFGSESYRAGIWQLLTGEMISVSETEKKK